MAQLVECVRPTEFSIASSIPCFSGNPCYSKCASTYYSPGISSRHLHDPTIFENKTRHSDRMNSSTDYLKGCPTKVFENYTNLDVNLDRIGNINDNHLNFCSVDVDNTSFYESSPDSDFLPPRSSASGNTGGQCDLGVVRRQTWSPVPGQMRLVTNEQSVQRYHGNGRLDTETDIPEYEEDETFSPPQITPVSGKLNTTPDQLVRPIPFKPVVLPRARYVSTPSTSSSLSRHTGSASRLVPNSQDDGYMSREYANRSASNASQSSTHVDVNSSFNGDEQSGLTRTPHGPNSNSRFKNHETTALVAESYGLDNSRGVTTTKSLHRRGGYAETPSPSDSGVGELEAILREKDCELARLRETMERNENAILDVLREKQRCWETEIESVNAEWERKLRCQQQKSFRTEQCLLLQVFKLQQENKAMKTSDEQAKADLERTAQACVAAEAKSEELRWNLGQKAGEISLLKSQLKSARDDLTVKSSENVEQRLLIKDAHVELNSKTVQFQNLKSELTASREALQQSNEQMELVKRQLDSIECELDAKTRDAERLREESRSELEELKAELTDARLELGKIRTGIQREREQWLNEKAKVINYQKHLQLNYTQMSRKNKLLESEVQQLTTEIEMQDTAAQYVHNEP